MSEEVMGLPAADALAGDEGVHVVQNGNSRRTSIAEITADKEPLGRTPGRLVITGDYTLIETDAGYMIESNAAGEVTLTIPADADAALPLHTVLQLARIGAGDFAIAPAEGVTLVSTNANRKLAQQYGTGTLFKRGVNSWLLSGALKA